MTFNAYRLYVYNGSQIDNEGTLDFQTDDGLIWWGGAAPRFSNSGTVLKSAGSGWSYLSMTVVNTGTIRVTSGSLELGNGNSPTPSSTTTALEAAGHGLGLEGPFAVEGTITAARSEERRVGKECRSRWWAGHEKKKRGDKTATGEDIASRHRRS